MLARANAADVDQWYFDVLAARGNGQPLVPVLESELERQVFNGVAIVVDMDLVHAVGVHDEEVRTAVDVLKRQVVG